MTKKQPKKEEKKKKTHPYASEKITVQYIHENPNCTKRDLNRDLAHDYTDEPRIKKEMTRTTLNRGLEWLITHEHILESDNRGYIVNPDIDMKTLYPNIWKKKEMEYLDFKKKVHKSSEMLKLYIDDDILRRAINKHTRIEILSQAKTFYFSDEMDELFHNLIYSILIECFFNNPDHWHNIESSENLNFSIEIKANWSDDPEIYNRLLNRKNKDLKDNYLYPFAHSVFHNWANEDKRKEILKNRTEQDLFNKAFTEDQMRKERIEKHKQKIRRLKPIYLAQVDKETEKVKGNYCPYCKQDLEKKYIIDQERPFSGYVLTCNKCNFFRRLDVDSKEIDLLLDVINITKENIENEYIDFEEEVILQWIDRGKIVFDNRDGVILSRIIRMTKQDGEFNEGNDPEKEWREHWEDVIRSGDFKSEPKRSNKLKELNDKFPDRPENITMRDLIETFKYKYPEKVKRIEERVDADFERESIRNLKKNKDFLK